MLVRPACVCSESVGSEGGGIAAQGQPAIAGGKRKLAQITADIEAVVDSEEEDEHVRIAKKKKKADGEDEQQHKEGEVTGEDGEPLQAVRELESQKELPGGGNPEDMDLDPPYVEQPQPPAPLAQQPQPPAPLAQQQPPAPLAEQQQQPSESPEYGMDDAAEEQQE